MKKTILLFALFLSFVACSGDDDKNSEEQQIPPKTQPSENYNELILGRWDFEKQCEDNAISGDIICSSPFDEGYFYIFKDDNILLTDGLISSDEEGSYSLVGSTLTLKPSSFPITVEVYRLTENELILVSSGDDSVLYRIFRKTE